MGRFILLLAMITGFVAMAAPRIASAGQSIVNTAQICDYQTAKQEHRDGIPKNLLKAISLAETGRWNPEKQATFAWPWTVMALGQGHFFPTRQAALDYIHGLRERGVTNIDVGCMQVNLYYHGDAFDSIEQALDPATNTAYAASYLKRLYKAKKSWTQAAASYHSSNRERAQAYKLKVLKYWNAARKPQIQQTAVVTQIDHIRMAELNTRRKVRMQSAEITDLGKLRRNQIATWKTTKTRGLDIGQLATMRRVQKKSAQRREFLGTDHDASGDAFTSKRRQQLKIWRKTQHLPRSG